MALFATPVSLAPAPSQWARGIPGALRASFTLTPNRDHGGSPKETPMIGHPDQNRHALRETRRSDRFVLKR
jgi:hypothetical protein